MQHNVRFESNNYRKICWSNMLKVCFEINTISKLPTLISNHDLLFIPESFAIELNEINIATPKQCGRIKIKDLQFYEHDFLESCSIKVAKISSIHSKELEIVNNDRYLKICRDICIAALVGVQDIQRYSYDHLSHREANGLLLVQHEVIKISLAQIICHLESAKAMLALSFDVDSISAVFEYLLNALHILAELNGGRAMLRGNAIEFMFHLNLFNSVFAMKEY